MPGHISATLSYVAAWEGGNAAFVFPSLWERRWFISIYTPVSGTVGLKTLPGSCPTFGHQKCFLQICLCTCLPLTWESTALGPGRLSLYRSGLVPWQSEPRECLCILHRQSQVLETGTRTCSFLAHEYPVSVSGNRVVLCPCNGSVSLYFLPVPFSDWLSPSCEEQKPEV